MSNQLPALIDAFAGLRVLVLGDAILDSYLEGTTDRFCREAPVPSIRLFRRQDVPGGAANTAVNVHSLGAQVSFLTAVGSDPEAELLRQALQARGVPSEHLLAEASRRTLTKHRLVVASQLLMKFDQGDTRAIEPATEKALADRLSGIYPAYDAVIVSDYSQGVIGPTLLRRLKTLQAAHPRPLVVDSRQRLEAFREIAVTAVKPNFEEALALLGLKESDLAGRRVEALTGHGERILELTGARLAALTLDREGALLFERGRAPLRSYARTTQRPQVTGAGDTFVAALTLALAAGASSRALADLASAAASIVVAKDGTATCSAGELREFVSPPEKYVPELERLASRVEFLRQRGSRIVFTNGCFDILHRGHIQYLYQAKSLGNVLIVGVNSDSSIRRLKGVGRPINRLEDRIKVLEALGCIDHLTAFDETTSCNLIRAIRPDVFVKGSNYTRDNLPEAPLVEELGGEVRLLPYTPDFSTTDLIDRIRAAAGRRPVAMEAS